MIRNPSMGCIANNRALEDPRIFVDRVHAHSRQSLGKLNDLDPDHEGEIQSNRRVDLTQPRALAQRISVAHISITQPFYKSRSVLPPDSAFGSFLSGLSSDRAASRHLSRENPWITIVMNAILFLLYGCNLMERSICRAARSELYWGFDLRGLCMYLQVRKKRCVAWIMIGDYNSHIGVISFCSAISRNGFTRYKS